MAFRGARLRRGFDNPFFLDHDTLLFLLSVENEMPNALVPSAKAIRTAA